MKVLVTNIYTNCTKLYTVLVVMISFNFPIDLYGQDYISGKELCQNISKKQSGRWIPVPNSYTEFSAGTSPLYYRFLNGEYDSTKATVVYVDGGPGGTSHNYHRMYDELSLEYNILFFDQRGFVCSRPDTKKIQDDHRFYSVENSARDIEEIRKTLGIKDLKVLGHSFGATISLKYAELFPNNLSKVTLIGPAFITPQKKDFQQKFDNRLTNLVNNKINRDVHNCNSLKFVNNMAYDFANALGLDGVEKLISRVESDLLESNSIMNEDEAYSLLTDLMGGNLGQFALKDDLYTWETQGNTEIVIINDFQCSFLSDDEENCIEGGNAYKNTFDVKKLKIDVPVDIFLGEFDGVEDELKELKLHIKQGKFYYLNGRGHGTFMEFYDLEDSEKAQISLKVLNRSLSKAVISNQLKTELDINEL